MSEYQYYEFQAIDRPLNKKEMAQLRAYSTRARITATSFVNDYSWGNFKGDADAWMDKYFDAFLYRANWGTHVLELRLPANLLNAKTARLYAVGDHTVARVRNGNVVLTFQSENENSEDWMEDEGWLASLISVRAELARGDLRALYLGWLLCAQSGDLDSRDLSPPVPAGLAKLSASLASLVTFLRIDETLVQFAARLATKTPSVGEILRHAETASAERRRRAARNAVRGGLRRETTKVSGRSRRIRTIAG